MATYTIYSDTGDGNVRKSNSSFATARSSASADAVQGGSTGYMSNGKEGSTYNFYNPFFMFDTGSVIGSGETISSAVFSVYLAGDNTNAGSETATVCQSKQATWNSLVVGDFDDRRDSISSGTEGATRVSLPATGSTSGYLDFTLNSTGRGWVARSGETKPASASASGKTQLAINFNFDLDNSAPTANDGFQIYFADQTGTTNDPKLVVVTSTDVTNTPSAQGITFTIPAYTVSAIQNTTQTPSALSIVLSLPSATVSAIRNNTETPAVQSVVFSIPAYNVLTPDANVTPATQVLTFSTPTPSISAERHHTETPSAVGITFSTPAPSVGGGSDVTPATQAIAFSIPTLAVDAQRQVTVTPSALSFTFSIPSASAGVGVTVTLANAQAITFTAPSFTVSTVRNVTVTPDPVSMAFAIPTYEVIADFWQDKFVQPTGFWGDKF